MPRINPTVSNGAKRIYDKWEPGERGHKVTEAIIQYEDNSLEKRVDKLESEVKGIKDKLEGGKA